jgi:uncharacterized protein DUF547
MLLFFLARLAIVATALLVGPRHANPPEYLTAYTRVLSDVLTQEGQVRYDVLVGHPDFPPVVEAIEQFDFSEVRTDAGKLAFWMNAYNIHMLNAVSAHPGRAGVLEPDDGEVFFKTPFRAAGHMLTLDQIEHGILRKQESALSALAPSQLDPRIHVGLNCAAVSCPRLWPEAFDGDRLEEQLDRAMTAFVDSPEHFSVEEGLLIASALLDWYGEDFDTAGTPAGDYLLGFMSPSRADYPELQDLLKGKSAREIKDSGARFQYDWTVNRAR